MAIVVQVNDVAPGLRVYGGRRGGEGRSSISCLYRHAGGSFDDGLCNLWDTYLFQKNPATEVPYFTLLVTKVMMTVIM